QPHGHRIDVEAGQEHRAGDRSRDRERLQRAACELIHYARTLAAGPPRCKENGPRAKEAHGESDMTKLAQPQAAILLPPPPVARHLEFALRPPAKIETIRDALAGLIDGPAPIDGS